MYLNDRINISIFHNPYLRHICWTTKYETNSPLPPCLLCLIIYTCFSVTPVLYLPGPMAWYIYLYLQFVIHYHSVLIHTWTLCLHYIYLHLLMAFPPIRPPPLTTVPCCFNIYLYLLYLPSPLPRVYCCPCFSFVKIWLVKHLLYTIYIIMKPKLFSFPSLILNDLGPHEYQRSVFCWPQDAWSVTRQSQK